MLQVDAPNAIDVDVASPESRRWTQWSVNVQHSYRYNPAPQRFFSTELAGRKERPETAIACQPETERFYGDVSSAASQLGYLTFYEPWCGSTPVAFDHGIVLKGRYFVPKVACDETFRRVGPGHLITGELPRDLQAQQIAALDMLGHTDPKKARSTDLYRQHHQRHILRRGPARGAFPTWTNRFMPAGRRIPRKLRGLDGTDCGVELGTIGLIGQETVQWC